MEKKRSNEGESILSPPGEDDAPHPKKKTRTRNKSSLKKEKLSITLLARLKCHQMAVQVRELKAATDNIAALNAEKHRLSNKVGYWKNETKKKRGVETQASSDKPAETLHEAIIDSITSHDL
eukprot:scaffold9412_cov24-Attheya_sp.AAC.1